MPGATKIDPGNPPEGQKLCHQRSLRIQQLSLVMTFFRDAFFMGIKGNSDGNAMGIIYREAYHKEVPLLGVPETPTD